MGHGGKNAASDVRAVQSALGIPADGIAARRPIAAIEAFQNIRTGQARWPVDAGGATERELAEEASVRAVVTDSYGGHVVLTVTAAQLGTGGSWADE